ncbi:membrane protein insertase YidC [Candidatus Thioglobus sp.]|nr:membrane protein insertase YidC [Candidatus Thioglobus sp.]MDB4099159.1 membrane protein insertase YidC [Candidatus Thioglobus sp.]
MNNQKTFLIIAIFLTIFLLWDKWSTDENGNIVMQMVPEETNSSTEVVNNSLESNLPDVSEVFTENSVDVSTPILSESLPGGTFTTVVTDLLRVEISHKGGTIINAFLNAYPKELGSLEKFQLLSNYPGNILRAESGIITSDNQLLVQSDFTSERLEYFLDDNSELIIPLSWKGNNGLIVTKNFHFKPDSYIVEVDYQITNNSSSDQVFKSYTQLVHGSSVETSGMAMGMQNFSGGATFNDEDVFEKIDFEDFEPSLKTTSKSGWAAMIQHYFFTAWIPNENNEEHTYSTNIAKNGNYELSIINPQIKVLAGETAYLQKNQLYIGPKEHVRLEELAPGLDKTVDYGFLFIVAKPLSIFLHWIYSFVGDWAISIILLTLSIKLAFYKLSEKSFRSMAGMKKLAPRLQKIKETYEGDKQKIGKKTMELYRTEKINPAAGCLPILVQIPVFISVYWVLIEMVELRQTEFLYIQDLAAKDPFYVLPLIMGASMWFQQRLNPPPADPIQAKIMMMLPVVFTVFFLWFPSGLVLYWVTNNVLSIAQQVYINKKING